MFVRRLLSAVSAVDIDLPYNWNWQRRWGVMDGFLQEHPIILMDVGARGDPPPELHSIRRHVRRVGFEPDPEECRRLNTSKRGTFFPTIVAGSTGRQTLNLYRTPEYSSTFVLTERYQRLWSGMVPIEKKLPTAAVDLDGFLTTHPEFKPDFLKLDTQGSELLILQGAEDALAGIGLVEVEVEFSAIYEGQPLFGDIASFMTNHGFELLYLNRAFVSRRQVYRGPSRGQVLFGDALFGKREDCLAGLSAEQQAKFAILLCQYGHLDIACQLLDQVPALNDLIPALRSTFRPSGVAVSRGILMQLDKILAIALHMRRYNQRATDSDRAWPVR